MSLIDNLRVMRSLNRSVKVFQAEIGDTGKKMRKVLVIGSGGAGKSTFARRLGELLELEVIHLDYIYWSPGWVEMPRA